MDPKISRQSLSGTINQKVYVWNLFLPKDRSLAFKNEGEMKPYFRDTYSGTPCIYYIYFYVEEVITIFFGFLHEQIRIHVTSQKETEND